MKTIDLTPTWEDILPMLLTAYEIGTPEGRRIAMEELSRMAKALDHCTAKERELKS